MKRPRVPDHDHTDLSMDAIISTKNQVDASSLLKLPTSDLVQLVLALKEKNNKTGEHQQSIDRDKLLLDLSRDAILSTQCEDDASGLSKLPNPELVELMLASKEKHKKTEQELAKTTKELAKTAEELAKTGEKLANISRNRYVVDPPVVGDRDGDDDLMEAICSKWSVDVAEDRSDARWLCGIGNPGMLYSIRDRKHVLSVSPHDEFSEGCQVLSDTVKRHIVDTGSRDNPDFKRVSEVISSAHLLYRLCCLFQGLPTDIDGPSGYKSVWTAFVKHEASGKVFGFGEYKAATMFYTPTGELEDEWVDDWIELLDLLCSDHCPHPYDGVVAGSVA